MRRVLAGLLVFDAVVAIALTWSLTPSASSHPQAPGFLLAIGGHPPVLVALGVVVVVGAVVFGFTSGWRQVAGALAALLGVGLLVESQAALLEGPMRFLFFTGACVLGWLAGLLVARGRSASEREALAEAGARGALAACYLGALVSKLSASGFSWVVDGGLRSTIAAQHHWGSSRALDALTRVVLGSEGLAATLALFTLLAQASAVLLVFPVRWRRVACVLLLLFHAGVWLLTPISFPQAMVLLVTVALLPERESPAVREVKWRALVVAAVALVGVTWLPGLRAYTALHHARPVAVVEAPAVVAEATTIAGVPMGLEVRGFRVVAVGTNEATKWARFERGAERVTVEFVTPGARGAEVTAPARSRLFELFYRTPAPGEVAPDDEERLGLLRELGALLDAEVDAGR